MLLKKWTLGCTALLIVTLLKLMIFWDFSCMPTALFGAPLAWVGGWISASYVSACIERAKKFQFDYILHYFGMVLNVIMLAVGVYLFWCGFWNSLIALLLCW